VTDAELQALREELVLEAAARVLQEVRAGAPTKLDTREDASRA
jgi:hypothetical protein